MEKVRIYVEQITEGQVLLTDAQLAQFEQYYDMLIEKNKVMNLTAITEREEVILKHFIDSLALAGYVKMWEKPYKIIDVGTTNELVKQIEGKVWSCVIPAHKMMDYEMRLRIINQRGEDNNQISIRYLADHSEVEGSIPAEPRLEDLYLWLFPQEDVEREGK